MKKLAIKGDSNRGAEVIRLLQMLGGRNVYGLSGISADKEFAISDDCDKVIILHPEDRDNYEIFTLDEFYEHYPL